MYDHRTPLEMEFDMKDTATIGFEFIVESFSELSKEVTKAL
jgi:hypothetical protein